MHITSALHFISYAIHLRSILMTEVTIKQMLTDDGIIEISDDGDVRSLYFGNNAKQSSMLLSTPTQLLLSYTEAMMLSLIFHSNPRSCLIIGLGGGSIAKYLHHHLPELVIDAIEIRHDVAMLAHDYFSLPRTKQISIIIGDAFEYLNQEDCPTYDLIFVDAFNHDGMAGEVKTDQFFGRCRQQLSKQGVLAVNLWASKQDQFPQTMAAIENSFDDTVLSLPVPDKGNIIAFAANHQNVFKRVNKKELKRLEEHFELNFNKHLRQLKAANRWRYFARLFI